MLFQRCPNITLRKHKSSASQWACLPFLLHGISMQSITHSSVSAAWLLPPYSLFAHLILYHLKRCNSVPDRKARLDGVLSVVCLGGCEKLQQKIWPKKKFGFGVSFGDRHAMIDCFLLDGGQSPDKNKKNFTLGFKICN